MHLRFSVRSFYQWVVYFKSMSSLHCSIHSLITLLHRITQGDFRQKELNKRNKINCVFCDKNPFTACVTPSQELLQPHQSVFETKKIYSIVIFGLEKPEKTRQNIEPIYAEVIFRVRQI